MGNCTNQGTSIIAASLKIIEAIIQNTGQIPELGNPNQNENVYKTTEYKYFKARETKIDSFKNKVVEGKITENKLRA